MVEYRIIGAADQNGMRVVQYQLYDGGRVLTTDTIRLRPWQFKDADAQQAFLDDWLQLQCRKVEKGKPVREGKPLAEKRKDEKW